MNVRRSSLHPSLCLAALLLFAAGDAAAALYKWTDANGRVVYSDQPPPGNVKVETLNAPPPPANPNAAKELANKEMEYKQRQLESVEAGKKAEKERVAAKDLADNCAQLKASLAQLAGDQVTLYRLNEKGERIVMDDAARRAERDKLVKWMRDNKCPG
jgi:Domain of unknown function (DUF4124)